MKNVMFSFKSFTASFLFLRSSRSKALRYRTAILVSNIPRVLASWFHPSPLSRFDTHSQAILGTLESKMAACNENARGLAQMSMVTGHQSTSFTGFSPTRPPSLRRAGRREPWEGGWSSVWKLVHQTLSANRAGRQGVWCVLTTCTARGRCCSYYTW